MDDEEPNAGWLARITLFSHVDGGRRNGIELHGSYRPHLRIGDGELLGMCLRSSGSLDALEPGETGEVVLTPIYQIDYSALVVAAHFTIFEGHRAVGVGTVLAAVA